MRKIKDHIGMRRWDCMKSVEGLIVRHHAKAKTPLFYETRDIHHNAQRIANESSSSRAFAVGFAALDCI